MRVIEFGETADFGAASPHVFMVVMTIRVGTDVAVCAVGARVQTPYRGTILGLYGHFIVALLGFM